MKIDEAEVRETAALARLALTDEEVARMTRELDAILDYMARLAAVDLEGVEPMTSALEDVAGRLRDDRVGPHLTVDEALADAPRRDGDFFAVPRVIAHDKDA